MELVAIEIVVEGCNALLARVLPSQQISNRAATIIAAKELYCIVLYIHCIVSALDYVLLGAIMLVN